MPFGFWQRSCCLFQAWNKAGKKDAGIVLRRLKLLRSIIKKIRLIKITFRIMTKLGGGGGKRVQFHSLTCERWPRFKLALHNPWCSP